MGLIKKIILVILLLFLFSSLTKNLFNYREKIKFYEDYKKEYEKELKKNITLKTDVIKKSDPNEIEKTIRNKLNLLQPDEIAVMLQMPSPTPIIITPTPMPNWMKWWKIFVK